MDEGDLREFESDSSHKSPLPWRSHRRIQRLTECQHFHYPSVEIGPVLLRDVSVQGSSEAPRVEIEIVSNAISWRINRALAEFLDFDQQLHRCVFERRHSKLEELEFSPAMSMDDIKDILTRYCQRLSQVTGSLITCYPVLKFLEIDCRGNRFEAAEDTAINTPAVAAAVVTKDFLPTEPSHLRLWVGDILSIIEMNSGVQNDSTFWKAKLTIAAGNRPLDDRETKLGFEVGYFPSDCVRLIDDKRLPSPLSSHRKSTIKTARRVTEMIRNRVRRRAPIFGMDLSEHLERSGKSVPLILERCCEAIEKLGIVTGIYRQCGIQSNIQRLRAKYDSGNEPDLFEFGHRDIYSVSSLLKQYFRQLPNPLFTFESYSSIVAAFDGPEDGRADRLRPVLLRLRPTHYRTASYLMKHLNRLCEHTNLTDMTAKNLAIVWAPNLFRSPPTLNGTDSHLLSGLNVHTSLCNYLITNASKVFEEDENEDFRPHSNGSTVIQVRNEYIEDDTYQPQLISKSATLSDMRSSHESRWPRFLRGRSVEGFWKFHRRSTLNSTMNTSVSTEPVKWRRSHSTDASLHSSRADSIMSFVSRGMDELRGGVRSLRDRARSLRPTSRPPPSPGVRLRHYSQAPPSPNSRRREDIMSQRNGQLMQESITTSTLSQYSEDTYFGNKTIFLTPQVSRKESATTDKSSISESPSQRGDSELRERRVMFKQEEPADEDASDSQETVPLCERSSPVEEWSSDSRDSPHLEMSRYDNVSPSGTLTRAHRDRVTRNLSTPVSLYDQGLKTKHDASALGQQQMSSADSPILIHDSPPRKRFIGSPIIIDDDSSDISYSDNGSVQLIENPPNSPDKEDVNLPDLPVKEDGNLPDLPVKEDVNPPNPPVKEGVKSAVEEVIVQQVVKKVEEEPIMEKAEKEELKDEDDLFDEIWRDYVEPEQGQLPNGRSVMSSKATTLGVASWHQTSADRRPLRKSKIGPPDVYPQDPRQEEDNLTNQVLCRGYQLTTRTYEHDSLVLHSRSPKLDKVNDCVGKCANILAMSLQKKGDINATLDRERRKSKDSSNAQFLTSPQPGTTKAKDRAQFFSDLAKGKPLSQLAKRIPMFSKRKEEYLDYLCDYKVPTSRALWFLKITAALSIPMQGKGKKSTPDVFSADYRNLFNTAITDLMTKLWTVDDLTTSPVYNERWKYVTELVRRAFDDGVIEKQEFLNELCETFSDFYLRGRHGTTTYQGEEKPALLRMFLLLLSQFIKYIHLNIILARRTAHMLAMKLRLIKMEYDARSAHEPAIEPAVQTPTDSIDENSQPPMQTVPINIYHTLIMCKTHRHNIYILSALLQSIVIEAPSSVIWNKFKVTTDRMPFIMQQLVASPLDMLPCPVYELPVQPDKESEKFVEILKLRNTEITRRSQAVQDRWSFSQKEHLKYAKTIDICLNIVGILDAADVLQMEGVELLTVRMFDFKSKNFKEEVLLRIKLMFTWATIAEREGTYRACIVCKVLRNQVDRQGSYVFGDMHIQDIIEMYFVTESTKIGSKNFPVEFGATMALFLELIRQGLFNHDGFVKYMIINAECDFEKPIFKNYVKAPEVPAINMHPHFEDLTPDEPPPPTGLILPMPEIKDEHILTEMPESEMPYKHKILIQVPLPQSEHHRSEANQRALVLFGMGDERQTHREELKKIARDICRIWQRRIFIQYYDETGKWWSPRRHSAEKVQELLLKFRQQTYYDQVVICGWCAESFSDMVRDFVHGNSLKIPTSDGLAILLSMFETAEYIYGIFEFCEAILPLLNCVEKVVRSLAADIIPGSLAGQLGYVFVGYLSKHWLYYIHSGKAPIITNMFYDIVERMIRARDYPATCWGRVIAAFVYHSKVQLKKSGLTTIKLKGSHSEFRNVFNHGNSTTNESQRYNSMFFNDIFDGDRPTIRMMSFHEYKKRLPSFNLLHNRYSFVINSFLAAQKCGRDFDRLVELSVISGHISAQIPALADEWVSAIKALCTTNARDREMMGYRELTIDVKDCSNHYPLATFIMLLAGKYAFSVPRLVAELLNHVFPKVMQKDQWNGHNASNYDGEAGVCLALQVLSAISCRKDEPYLVSRHYKGDEDKIKLVPESADEIILAMIHWNEMDNVLFPMLSNICILQDTLRNRHKDLELELPRIVESTWYRKEYLTIIVKTALNVICEEEWVTMKMYDIVQTNNMSAFNCDRLKQNFLGQQLLRLGIRRRSEREIVRELTICNGNSKKALIDKLLSSMNLWNLRATLFDLMLMIKEISPTEITQKVHHASTNAADALMGEIGKCCRDLFTTAYKEGKQLPPATLYKLDENFRIESISNYWLIASLVKICPQPTNMPLTFTSTTVAGKFLKEAASMLDTANDSSKERIQQSTWLLSQQAFLNLVLTSMKCEKDNHNNDSKSLLVGSLFKQLQDMTLKTKENPALPHMDKFASEREGLLLRLSLVGGIFPHICNQAHSESWALLLFQMMLNGVICPDKDRVLYDSCYDMLSTLMLWTLTEITNQQTTTPTDHNTGDMKYRWPQYLGVIKKLKKEIAEHPVPPELRHLHQLVPIPKNTLDVLVVEPFGTPLPIPQGGKIPYNAASQRLQQQIKPISGMRHGRLALQPAEKIKVSSYDFISSYVPDISSKGGWKWSMFQASKVDRCPVPIQRYIGRLLQHKHVNEFTRALMTVAENTTDPFLSSPVCEMTADTPTATTPSSSTAATTSTTSTTSTATTSTTVTTTTDATSTVASTGTTPSTSTKVPTATTPEVITVNTPTTPTIKADLDTSDPDIQTIEVIPAPGAAAAAAVAAATASTIPSAMPTTAAQAMAASSAPTSTGSTPIEMVTIGSTTPEIKTPTLNTPLSESPKSRQGGANKPGTGPSRKRGQPLSRQPSQPKQKRNTPRVDPLQMPPPFQTSNWQQQAAPPYNQTIHNPHAGMNPPVMSSHPGLHTTALMGAPPNPPHVAQNHMMGQQHPTQQQSQAVHGHDQTADGGTREMIRSYLNKKLETKKDLEGQATSHVHPQDQHGMEHKPAPNHLHGQDFSRPSVTEFQPPQLNPPPFSNRVGVGNPAQAPMVRPNTLPGPLQGPAVVHRQPNVPGPIPGQTIPQQQQQHQQQMQQQLKEHHMQQQQQQREQDVQQQHQMMQMHPQRDQQQTQQNTMGQHNAQSQQQLPSQQQPTQDTAYQKAAQAQQHQYVTQHQAQQHQQNKQQSQQPMHQSQSQPQMSTQQTQQTLSQQHGQQQNQGLGNPSTAAQIGLQHAQQQAQHQAQLLTQQQTQHTGQQHGQHLGGQNQPNHQQQLGQTSQQQQLGTSAGGPPALSFQGATPIQPRNTMGQFTSRDDPRHPSMGAPSQRLQPPPLSASLLSMNSMQRPQMSSASSSDVKPPQLTQVTSHQTMSALGSGGQLQLNQPTLAREDRSMALMGQPGMANSGFSNMNTTQQLLSKPPMNQNTQLPQTAIFPSQNFGMSTPNNNKAPSYGMTSQAKPAGTIGMFGGPQPASINSSLGGGPSMSGSTIGMPKLAPQALGNTMISNQLSSNPGQSMGPSGMGGMGQGMQGHGTAMGGSSMGSHGMGMGAPGMSGMMGQGSQGMGAQQARTNNPIYQQQQQQFMMNEQRMMSQGQMPNQQSQFGQVNNQYMNPNPKP